MTVEEFNALDLSKNDNVQITHTNGTVITATLFSGIAYLGRGEYKVYTTKEIVPAQPPTILINANPNRGGAENIILSEVERVDLIEN